MNTLTDTIIGAAIEVHKVLGPGLLEAAYKKALAYELRLRGLNVKEEVSIPLVYKNLQLDMAYRADLVVEDKVIVELKATESDKDIYCKQLFTYLKLSNRPLGLLINFNKYRLVDGLKRIINGFISKQ